MKLNEWIIFLYFVTSFLSYLPIKIHEEWFESSYCLNELLIGIFLSYGLLKPSQAKDHFDGFVVLCDVIGVLFTSRNCFLRHSNSTHNIMPIQYFKFEFERWLRSFGRCEVHSHRRCGHYTENYQWKSASNRLQWKLKIWTHWTHWSFFSLKVFWV